MLQQRPLHESSGSFRATYDGHIACLDVGSVGFHHVGAVTCVARNTQGEAASTARIIIKGSARPSSKSRSSSAPGGLVESTKTNQAAVGRVQVMKANARHRAASAEGRIPPPLTSKVNSKTETLTIGEKVVATPADPIIARKNKKNIKNKSHDPKQNAVTSTKKSDLKTGSSLQNKLSRMDGLNHKNIQSNAKHKIVEKHVPYQPENNLTSLLTKLNFGTLGNVLAPITTELAPANAADLTPPQLPDKEDLVVPRWNRATATDVQAAKMQGPAFADEPRSVEAEEGQPARLIARVRGEPPPHVSWRREGERLLPGPSCRLESNGIRHICTLMTTQLSDSGLYEVVAINAHGEAMCSVSVKIHAKAEPPSPPQQKCKRPLFVQPLTDLTIGEGAEAVLDCKVVGIPSPTLTWYFEQDILSSSEDIRISYQDATARLCIPAVLVSHSGTFTCRAANQVGEAVSCASLTVLDFEGPHSFGKAFPASIIKGPESITILKGDRAILRVHYSGNPPPVIRWVKGGHCVTVDDRISMTNVEGMACLTIDNVECDDSGKYVVMVENEHGSDCHFASVAVEGPPEPPAEGPNIAEVTSVSSITLSWYGSVYDGGSIITGYILEMKKIDTEEECSQWQILTSNCHSTSYKVKNLDPEAEYIFRVRAQNVHGISSPSQESEPIRISSFQEKQNDSSSSSETDFCAALDHQSVCFQNEANFNDLYDINEEIGKGRFGTVHKVTAKKTGRVYAGKFIKCILAKDKEKAQQEVEIMNCLHHHPKLLQLVAAFEKPREVIMILEYIAGGELFERVVAEDFVLTERDCILFTRQICEGVKYIHEKSIIHLDLKPENILCLSKHNHQIKLIDFGLARRYDPDVPLKVMFGTPEFIAPEIINYEPISPASDMWSVGVICYVLLSGLSPFMGENDAETFSNITRAEFDFDDDAFKRISADAKSFISNLLINIKEKRLTADGCLKHIWLAQHERTMSTMELSTDKLKKFIIRRKWQKTGTAIRAVGRMVSLSGLSSRRSSWNSSRSSGSISESELSYGSVLGSTKGDSIQEEDVFECKAPSSSEHINIIDPALTENHEGSILDKAADSNQKLNLDSNNVGKTKFLNKSKNESLTNYCNDTKSSLGKYQVDLKDRSSDRVPSNIDNKSQSQVKFHIDEPVLVSDKIGKDDTVVKSEIIKDSFDGMDASESNNANVEHYSMIVDNKQSQYSSLLSQEQKIPPITEKCTNKTNAIASKERSSPLGLATTKRQTEAASKFGVVLRSNDTSKQRFLSSPFRPTMKPEFLQPLKESTSVRLGGVIQFETQVKGRPLSQVRWFHNNIPIFESRREKLMHVGNGVYSLMILNVKKSDEGVYKCCASNEAGTITSEGQLTVMDKQQ